MKTLIVAAIRCSLMFLMPTVTYAISTQWDLDPISGDWNTPVNWTPNGVPNGAADIATFGLSNMTNVSISANTQVNGVTFTPAATNPYVITVNPDITRTLSGKGITNNSGITQRFDLNSLDFGDGANMHFTHSASAGNAAIFSNVDGSIEFRNRSTASSATISFLTNSELIFRNRSTAGSATIDWDVAEGASVRFFDSSTAGSAVFIDDGSFFCGVNFYGHSSAGSADITALETGQLGFHDHSSAANVTLHTSQQSTIVFTDSSTAGNATIEVTGTAIYFLDSSKGGTAAFYLEPFDVDADNTLYISSHSAPGVTIGSLAGDYFVELGANNLTIGSNNRSTTFSGVIQDGSGFGTGGSLTKIGSGTLTLAGANTYTGNTNINRGVLQVDGSITSNTFVNQHGTLAGTGTINGNVANNGRVSPGSAGSPGMLTVTGNYTQAQYAALMIQLAGVSAGDFSVLNILGTANLSGRLEPVLLNGFLPTVGESFTFLQYGAVNGTLFIHNRNIDDLPEHSEVSYFPTFAVLSVAAGNVPVPDQASTLLLLMLGLSALLMCRRHLVCKQK